MLFAHNFPLKIIDQQDSTIVWVCMCVCVWDQFDYLTAARDSQNLYCHQNNLHKRLARAIVFRPTQRDETTHTCVS